MISELSQYEDLKNLLFGKALGIGVHRKVGAYALDPSLVIKVALDTPNINILEWETWLMVQDVKEVSAWLAPCINISPCGLFLLQRRVETKPKSEYPKYVPSFFGDMKYANFGWLDGKFVCCDYASFIYTSMVHKWSGRLKKADWWE